MSWRCTSCGHLLCGCRAGEPRRDDRQLELHLELVGQGRAISTHHRHGKAEALRRIEARHGSERTG